MRRDDFRLNGGAIDVTAKKLWAALLTLATLALILYAAATAARSVAASF
ncbi:MAG: hypothetical protein P4L83_09150 [Nevskia sp.]|nr:hypothetical protein [Nevskia sp.]